MLVTCESCGLSYNDEYLQVVCPHIAPGAIFTPRADVGVIARALRFTRRDAFFVGFALGMLAMDALYVFVAFWLFP